MTHCCPVRPRETHISRGYHLLEEDGEIISRKTIENSIDHGVAYCIWEDGIIVGGLVLKID